MQFLFSFKFHFIKSFFKTFPRKEEAMKYLKISLNIKLAINSSSNQIHQR